MSLHPNHMIKGLSCRQEARIQIISLLLSMVLTYTCAIFKTTKNNKTLHQFCGSLYATYMCAYMPHMCVHIRHIHVYIYATYVCAYKPHTCAHICHIRVRIYTTYIYATYMCAYTPQTTSCALCFVSIAYAISSLSMLGHLQSI